MELVYLIPVPISPSLQAGGFSTDSLSLYDRQASVCVSWYVKGVTMKDFFPLDPFKVFFSAVIYH